MMELCCHYYIDRITAGVTVTKHWQSSVQVQMGGELSRDSLHAWCDGVQESFIIAESDLIKTTSLCYRLLEFPAPAAGVILPAQMPSLPAQCSKYANLM